MALLRASSKAIGDVADETMAVGSGDAADTSGGVEAGQALVVYAEAVHNRSGVAAAFDALAALVGVEGAAEAALTCAAFNGYVRIADGIGIQLDDGTESTMREARSELGIDSFGGAANTTSPPVSPVPDDSDSTHVGDLFSSAT